MTGGGGPPRRHRLRSCSGRAPERLRRRGAPEHRSPRARPETLRTRLAPAPSSWSIPSQVARGRPRAHLPLLANGVRAAYRAQVGHSGLGPANPRTGIGLLNARVGGTKQSYQVQRRSGASDPCLMVRRLRWRRLLGAPSSRLVPLVRALSTRGRLSRPRRSDCGGRLPPRATGRPASRVRRRRSWSHRVRDR